MFEFVLKKEKYYRYIFRFIPENTHVHGYEEETIPTSWEEVYKVYYSYIIIRHDLENNCEEIMFNDSICDECSVVPDIVEGIKQIIQDKKSIEYTFYQDIEWNISYYNECYKFVLFSINTNRGYRFYLTENKVLQFCDWLDKINDYALKHAEPI